MSIGHTDTHAKNTQSTQRLPSCPHSTHRLSHLVPQGNETPISGMSNIVPRPTNVPQPLKSLKTLAVSHSVKDLQQVPSNLYSSYTICTLGHNLP